MTSEATVQRNVRYSLKVGIDPNAVAAVKSRAEVREAIVKATQIVTDMDVEVIKGDRRDKPAVAARQAVIWLMIENMPKISQSEIARWMHRDHTTIIHSKQIITEEYAKGGTSRTELIDDIRKVAQGILAGLIDKRAIREMLNPKIEAEAVPEDPVKALDEEARSPARHLSRHGRVDARGVIILNP